MEGSSGRLSIYQDQSQQLSREHKQEGGVAFALSPVSMEQLQAVINRKKTLPPKSTYFEPKVRSGIFVIER